MDFTPIILSLKAAVIATILTFVVGLFAAKKVVNLKRGKAVVDTLLILPMILPPTVVGFFLLLLFGKNSIIGSWLLTKGISVIFSFTGIVIASATVSFPLMYRTMRGALEQLDETLVQAGRTLGLSNTIIFWKIIIPNCWSGIMGGTILAFSRALGEFGATIMLSGNIAGKTRTASIAVYTAMQSGNRTLAYQWVGVVVLFSFLSIFGMNYLNGRQQKKQFRRK